MDPSAKIGAHLEADGDLAGTYHADQSLRTHPYSLEGLATKNAGVVFAEKEFEWASDRDHPSCLIAADTRDDGIDRHTQNAR